MASTDFTTRIGVQVDGIEIDAVGGNFAAATKLGPPSRDGITFEMTSEYARLFDGARLGLREIVQHSKELAVSCALLDHKAAHLALSMGQPTSDVTDNSGASPKNEDFDFLADFKGAFYYALRLKCPQPQALTLFDTVTLYRVAVIAQFSQAFQIEEFRFIPVRFEATMDPANDYKFGTVVTEYV